MKPILIALAMLSAYVSNAQTKDDKELVRLALKDLGFHRNIAYAASASLDEASIEKDPPQTHFVSVEFHSKDSLIVTPAELEELRAQITATKQFVWPENLIRGATRMTDTMKNLSQIMEWPDEGNEKSTGPIYHLTVLHFSKPVYLRDSSLALVQSSYHCGFLCGGSETAFYRKQKGVWAKWFVISGYSQ